MPWGNKSAIRPGRMRKTDEVKGPNCPIPSSPGVCRHVYKRTGEVHHVG